MDAISNGNIGQLKVDKSYKGIVYTDSYIYGDQKMDLYIYIYIYGFKQTRATVSRQLEFN